ncbi:MAG TPA: beta-propeller fold lactonase family protein [Acidobacteriaceae bacterium]|jgi:6-phosphogluconolactonase (cycloisomerase 2 family)|nr:beta-propeller fold lactonase family protein [Acidobacteriaceae bacterium]
MAPLLLAGCQNLFVCEGKASCPSSGGGGSTSGDYAYVSNSSSGSTYLAGYDVSAGKLTVISGFPLNLGFIPVGLAVAPKNSFLYVASIPGAPTPGIYTYSISSAGVLTSTKTVISGAFSSIDISPDGNYLFAVGTDGKTLSEYQINTSTGALSPLPPFGVPGLSCAITSGEGVPASQSCTVKVSPSGQFVVAALGTEGDAIFPYSSSTGISSASYTLIPSGSTAQSPTGDYSLALDKNNYTYIARTSALAVYSISSTGTASQQSSVTYDSGSVTRSVVLGSTYNYVYTANEGASTISGYGIGNTGALAPVTGSPVSGPTQVSALGIDNTGAYMMAAGFDSSAGVQLFSISSSGALTKVASAVSGTSTAYPAVLALTH